VKQRYALLAIAGLVTLAAGCGGGSSAVVSGTVTYDGQPVENGTITLLPEDGKGPSAGGQINGGRYRVEGVTPGRKIVRILGVKAVAFARTTEELRLQAEEAARQGKIGAEPEPAVTIPPDAKGNNATVEVRLGSQTLDFQLEPPGR